MTIMRHRKLRALQGFVRSRRGNSGVEFALLLPILMLLLFGAIELGRALHDYHVVTQTVRDATRHLGRSPVDCTTAAPGSCATCNAQTGTCSGGCSFVNASDVTDAVELAMTGDTSGASELLAYWPHPPASPSGEIDIQICALDNSVANLSGLYAGDLVIPHVRMQAIVDFTFLFGELVTSDATIDFEISHNVVVTGE